LFWGNVFLFQASLIFASWPTDICFVSKWGTLLGHCYAFGHTLRYFLSPIGLHHSPDGITNPRYKLLCFITTIFCKEKNALAFNRDRCCHLALCLWLIPFHLDDTMTILIMTSLMTLINASLHICLFFIFHQK
jgi:hypothetical protein